MNRFYCYFRRCVLFGVVSTAVCADDDHPVFEDFKPPPEWQEQKVVLPDYPRDEDLQSVPLQLSDFPFQLALDRNSLVVGDDRVTRYTAVLETKDGVRNLFYEGIRCATGEYRSYAIGAGETLQPVLGSDWRPLRQLGVERYRYVLARYYLCDEDRRPRAKREALIQLRERWQHDDYDL